MSEYQILAVIAAFAFLYSLVASRLERTPINGALVYVVCGLICGPTLLDLIKMNVQEEGIKLLAELTLAVVLFSDSANANLRVLRRVEQLPIRLLLIGLPLTIALGFGVGYLLFDGMSLFAIALLATMLAPTDAALGKAVVTNEAVPDSIREPLNVESGLNDGICVPVLLIFLTLATEHVSGNGTLSMLIQFPLKAIGIGALVGVIFAIFGSQLLKFCFQRKWLAGTWMQVPIIALALMCFATAQWLGGSGFIASFVGGLIFGGLTHEHKKEVLQSAEGTGDTLSLLTWFTFGAVAVGPQMEHLSWQVLVYALLSLTVVRMLPVFLCVIGTKLQTDTKLFIGWFGPRGLASIVFIVIVVDKNLPENATLIAAVTWTVVLSIVLHGITANPLSKIYSQRVSDRNGVT
ncbi:MAG: cation:proton antiporter [Planctomycetes bacterium]|nr:cation:proton antiporter [Planctomycetota bacterium]MCH9725664.1 cation:proton antiporter [Planctomycetota bacterium]MCH9777718.1 cation:proton antiporter [Planctomycetota bacterium]MCH9793176.1 cation:proton antiporter [Planctomycetota bacterium]MDF1744165.1 cation:proton antiporter [Gimesia sp.]